MRTSTKVSLIVSGIILIAACNTTKKSTASTAIAPASTTTPTAPLVLVKPADGIYPPGENELIAIQAQYTDVTLDKLKQGHAIYTKGACVGCHGAENIYKHGETEWKGIIDDMAQKANISAIEKDAVYKYVLAIKATQPKGPQ